MAELRTGEPFGMDPALVTAVAAIFVGRFGDHTRRKALVAYFGGVTPYISNGHLLSFAKLASLAK